MTKTKPPFGFSRIGIPLLCFLVVACERSIDTTDADDDFIYANSFESDQDTVGWFGNGTRTFRTDVPEGGEERSLFIAGGCPYPHAVYEFTLKNAAALTVQCWGKNLAIGGGVWIQFPDARTHVGVDVTDSVWTRYVSTDTLFCPPGARIQLQMAAGGIAYSAMLVDLIEITNIQQAH